MTWFQDGTKLLISGNATVGPEKRAIWVVSSETGAVRLLRDDVWGAAVSPDGARIAFKPGGQSEIWLMGANGEDPRKLLETDPGYRFERIAWSPDGRSLAYMKSTSTLEEVVIQILDVERGMTFTVLSDRRLIDFGWAADGRIVYSLTEPPPNEYDSNLWQIRIDARTGAPSGGPSRLTSWIGFSPLDLSVTTDGKRLAFISKRDQSDVYVAELAAGGARLANARRLTLDERIDWPGGWTRDSRAVLFYSDRNGGLDLFRQGLDAQAADSILAGAEEKRLPQLSADGAWILYLAWPKADGPAPKAGRLVRLPVNGGPVQTVLDVRGYPGSAQKPRLRFTLAARGHPDFRCASQSGGPCVLSEVDGSQLVFSKFDPVQGGKTELLRIDADPAARPFWDLSPDGSRLAFGKEERQAGQVTILTLAGGARREIAVSGWTRFNSLGWAADGQSLFVATSSTRGSSLLHVALTGELKLLRKVTGNIERPIASPDGKYLTFGETSSNSNAWVIEGF